MSFFSFLRMPGLLPSFVISCGVQASAYAYSTFGRAEPTEHYYDISGAATHLAIVAHTVAAASARDGAVSPRVALMAGLSSLWAMRLGSYLFDRISRLGKDARFDALKTDPLWWTVPWAFQAVWCWALQSPLAMAAGTGLASRLTRRDALGAALFAGGLAWETIADAQKDAFKRRNRDAPMTEGLFSTSVYANYAGEITLWCGATLLALPAARLPLHVVAAAIAPAFDAFLLLRVSGIPMSEASSWRRYGSSEAYLEYRARTSMLLPWPPARTATPEALALCRARAAAAAAAAPAPQAAAAEEPRKDL